MIKNFMFSGYKKIVPRSTKLFWRSFSDERNYTFETLVEMQLKSCLHNKEYPFLGTRSKNKFDYITYGKFGEEVNKFRWVLDQHKIGKDDKVALISNNRVEWAVAYYAANSLGAQIVPMYEAQTEKDWQYILQDSEAKIILAATEKVYKNAEKYAFNFAKVESILCFDAKEDSLHSYKRWMAIADATQAPPAYMPSPDHLTAILYTSGTSGRPKGVELSHRNIVSNILATKEQFGPGYEDRRTTLAFIPWSHIFGMVASLHMTLGHGSCASIVEQREQIMECVHLIKPSQMSAVPLMLNRMYNAVHAQVAHASPVRQFLFRKAMEISRARNHCLEFNQPVSPFLAWQHGIVDKVVFSKIREKLIGGKADQLASGGSALSMPVLQFFEDVGLPVVEGYGLTETSPIVTTSTPDWSKRRLGCVGVPLPGVTVKIMDIETHKEMPQGEEGEIWVSGDNVTVGYRNNPEANKESFVLMSGLRFFRTGDQGKMVEGKFLKLTGRIKELYKLSNGKYIMPAPLEDMVNRSNYIGQTCIAGANQEFNVALIVPEYIELAKWLKETKHKLQDVDLAVSSNREEVLNDAAVIQMYSKEIIAGITESGRGFDRIVRWTPVLEAFSQENEMLTAKMSIRRNVIYKNYHALLEDMHAKKRGHVLQY